MSGLTILILSSLLGAVGLVMIIHAWFD